MRESTETIQNGRYMAGLLQTFVNDPFGVIGGLAIIKFILWVNDKGKKQDESKRSYQSI